MVLDNLAKHALGIAEAIPVLLGSVCFRPQSLLDKADKARSFLVWLCVTPDEELAQSPQFEDARLALVELFTAMKKYAERFDKPYVALSDETKGTLLAYIDILEDVIRGFNKVSGRLPDDGLPLPF